MKGMIEMKLASAPERGDEFKKAKDLADDFTAGTGTMYGSELNITLEVSLVETTTVEKRIYAVEKTAIVMDGAGNHVCDLDRDMAFCPLYPPAVQSLQEDAGPYKALAGGTDCEYTKDYSVIVGCSDAEPPPAPSSVTVASDGAGTDYDGEYTVSWGAVDDGGCAGLKHYELVETAGGGTTTYNVTQSSMFFAGKGVHNNF